MFMTGVLLREYTAVLVKWRKVILFNLLSISFISVVISLVLPLAYVTTTSILPPVEQPIGLSLGSLLGGTSGGLTGLSRMAGLSGFATPSDLFAEILQSRAVLEGVVRRCNLMDYYDVKLMELALSALSGATTIDVGDEGIIYISVVDGNPEVAAAVANSFVLELDRVNRKASMSQGKATRLFVQRRLNEVEVELVAAEESLRVFQERHKTVSLQDEVVKAIEAAAQLKAEISGREVQMRILTQFATPENPQMKQLKSEVRELDRQLRIMEYGRKSRNPGISNGFGAGFSVPFSKIPAVGMELARRMRDVEIQNVLYMLLTEQYEQAKIAEARDTPTVQVLDVAVPPEIKSYPQRKKLVLVGVILGLLIGVGLAFGFEALERTAVDPEERSTWRRLWIELCSDLAFLNRKVSRQRRKT